MLEDPQLRLLLLDAVERINAKLRSANDAEAAFSAVSEGIQELTDADYVAIALLEEKGDFLRLTGLVGAGDLAPITMKRFPVEDRVRNSFSDADASRTIRFKNLDEIPESVRGVAGSFGIAHGLLSSIVLRRSVIAHLFVGRVSGRDQFGPDTERMMVWLSDYIALVVNNVRIEFLMKRSREETEKVLSMAPIGIMSLDPRGIVRAANMQILKLLDKANEDEILGTSIFEIPAINKSGLDVLIMQCMEGHGAERTDVHYVPSPDRASYLHVKATPIMSERREVEWIVLVALDTTSKVRLESQLERSYEKLTQTYQELERVNLMKTQFIDVVSHELRTPLTVMRGYVDLVESEYTPKLDPKFGQRLKIIKANTDKLYALVESMLDVSRLEKGSLEIHPEPLKIDTVLEDLIKDRTKEAEDKRQTLTLMVDGSMPLIMADRRRIRDVFNNLVDNAIKYTEEGGKIQVGARDEGKLVHVWVKDNGIGIPLENLGKIFDRFYIVAKDDLAHQVDRIGLSLPISKGIVEAHGGRLWVESQVGKGSVFHVDLPKESQKL